MGNNWGLGFEQGNKLLTAVVANVAAPVITDAGTSIAGLGAQRVAILCGTDIAGGTDITAYTVTTWGRMGPAATPHWVILGTVTNTTGVSEVGDYNLFNDVTALWAQLADYAGTDPITVWYALDGERAGA